MFTAFENQIGDHNELWYLLKPVIDGGTVASREEAYRTFSRVLSFSNQVDETLSNLWKEVLEKGSFSIQGTDCHYDFKSVLSLLEANKRVFDMTWTLFDSKSDHLEAIGKGINAIAQDSIGASPGDKVQQILQSPNTFGLIAKCSETPIACIYGTYVESLQLFHFNFLGRKIDYPGVHIIEQLQTQIGPLLNRFPNLSCITLFVDEENTHARNIYVSLGFELLDDSKRFYGKKVQDEAVFPSYEKFKSAYENARKL